GPQQKALCEAVLTMNGSACRLHDHAEALWAIWIDMKAAREHERPGEHPPIDDGTVRTTDEAQIESRGVTRRCVSHVLNKTSRSRRSTIASTPSPRRQLVSSTGRLRRTFNASRCIDSRSAPTCGARSTLLMTSRSAR